LLLNAEAKTARVWKHEGFGQYYVMGWAAGHKLRHRGDDSVVKEVVALPRALTPP